MTAHAIVTLTIKSPEKIAAYREKAAEALAKHGGQVVQASKEPALIEGETELPDMAAVLSFPDRASALAWKNDPALHDLHALRQGSGASTIILL